MTATHLTLTAMGFCLVLLTAAQAQDDPNLIFQDRFETKLADGWTWLREDPKHWRISKPGLEVHIQPGNMWGPANDAKNVLLRDVPDPQRQPLEITAAISNNPTSQYEQVDLVWFYDQGHMVKVGQEMVDGKLSIVMGREENDKTRTISITPLDSTTVQLRMIVKDKQITGYFKTPKADWREVGHCTLPIKGPPHISLQFYQGPADAEHWAKVSEFTIRRTK